MSPLTYAKLRGGSILSRAGPSQQGRVLSFSVDTRSMGCDLDWWERSHSVSLVSVCISH